jgi:hypothetical protein
VGDGDVLCGIADVLCGIADWFVRCILLAVLGSF